MIRFVLSFCLSITYLVNTAKADDDQITVFAAASLTDVMPKLASSWHMQSNRPKPRFSFAASAVMARQIVAGAPADIFISANPTWVKYVRDELALDTPAVTLVKNQLVLAVPSNTPLPPKTNIAATDILSLIGSNRVAIADPRIAPAGQYAQQFLKSVDMWETLEPQLAYGANVRQTLLMVERGGLAGFVYGSDALKSDRVQIAYNIPQDLSGAVTYQAIQIPGQSHSAESFLAYLQSPIAFEIWQNAGFLKTVSN